MSLEMIAADGAIHQPMLTQAFDGESTAYRDFRMNTTDTSYTYQVLTEIPDLTVDAEVTIEKVSGEANIVIDGDMFTWASLGAGAVVRATVRATRGDETQMCTLTVTLVGRAV